MNLSVLRREFTKLERGITAADEGGYNDVLHGLMARRTVMNTLASHLLPRSTADAIFLHGIVDELSEFIDDEPASEADRADAIDAIRRINQYLSDYLLEP